MTAPIAPYDERSARFAAVLADASRADDTPADLRRRGEDVLPPIDLDDDACRRLVALGGELDALFGHDEATTVARLDAALAALRVRPRLVRHGDGPLHLHFERDGVDAVERVRANAVVALARVATTVGTARLGRCQADRCEGAFVDTSRAGRRRFCTTTCASRTHVAAHRARRAGHASASPTPATSTTPAPTTVSAGART